MRVTLHPSCTERAERPPRAPETRGLLVRDAMRTMLSEEEQELIWLYFYAQHDVKMLAKMYNQTVGITTRRIWKALRKLSYYFRCEDINPEVSKDMRRCRWFDNKRDRCYVSSYRQTVVKRHAADEQEARGAEARVKAEEARQKEDVRYRKELANNQANATYVESPDLLSSAEFSELMDRVLEQAKKVKAEEDRAKAIQRNYIAAAAEQIASYVELKLISSITFADTALGDAVAKALSKRGVVTKLRHS